MSRLIIQHCSPTLAGIKAGNMFAIRCTNLKNLYRAMARMNRILSPKGMQMCLLRFGAGRALLYLYRPAEVARILKDPRSRALLKPLGYTEGHILEHLRSRISHSLEFPHEIGIFLGYPIRDVEGFIKNQGQNCLLSGPWKVYTCPHAAEKTFCRYRKCQRIYRQRYQEGATLEKLAVSTVRHPSHKM